MDTARACDDLAQDAPRRLTTLRSALRWGCGHYAVLASAAAVGAGFARQDP